MPLVLAAIHLRLSASYEQRTARDQRLGSLFDIIHRSGTLYDVSDSVAAAINFILRLAYSTTHRIVDCADQGPTPAGPKMEPGRFAILLTLPKSVKIAWAHMER